MRDSLGETSVTLKAYYQSDPNDPNSRVLLTENAGKPGETIRLNVAFDLDTDSNNNGGVESTSNFHLNDNKTLSMNTVYEDMVEDLTGYGKRLYIGANLATEVRVNTQNLTIPKGYELQLIVSDGLAIWGNAARTVLVEGLQNVGNNAAKVKKFTETLPETLTFYVDATLTGERKIYLRLVKENTPVQGGNSDDTLARDTIRFSCRSVHLLADTNRDSVINNADEASKDSWTNDRGTIILFNGDDDNGDHLPDNEDNIINTGDLPDIGTIAFTRLGELPEPLTSYSVSFTVSISAGADPFWDTYEAQELIRIFLPQNGNYCQETDTGITFDSNSFTFNLDDENYKPLFVGEGVCNFGIEGIVPGAPVTITATLKQGDVALSSDTIAVKVTPFIAFSHESEIDFNLDNSIYVSITYENLKFVSDLKSVFNIADNDNKVKSVSLNDYKEKWWQDICEIGYVQSPYGSQHVILTLPRIRDNGEILLDYFKTAMISDKIGICTLLTDINLEENSENANESDDGQKLSAFHEQNNANSGGNFEVMPGKNSYGNFYGTIVVGKGADGEMDKNIIQFLKAQKVQDVISDLDISWLEVGHIDEVISFPTNANGRALVASSEAAYAMLLFAQKKNLGEQQIFPCNFIDSIEPFCDTRSYNVKELIDIIQQPENFNIMFGDEGYSQKLRKNVLEKLGLDTTNFRITNTNSGESANELKRVGYLEMNNTQQNMELQWRLEFINNIEYSVFYQNENFDWIFDGQGKKTDDFISESGMIYILHSWWGNQENQAGQKYTFSTFPCTNSIELPVLFVPIKMPFNEPITAIAFSNNVVNALVNGNTVIVANVDGPINNSVNMFNDYVYKALRKTGFTNIHFINDKYYHTKCGSVHCATNVFRKIPQVTDACWWQ